MEYTKLFVDTKTVKMITAKDRSWLISISLYGDESIKVFALRNIKAIDCVIVLAVS